MTNLATNVTTNISPKAAKLSTTPANIPRKKKIQKVVAENLNVTTPQGRSGVTNGSKVLLGGCMRKRTAKRFRDILSAIVADLGGIDVLTEGKRQLARRAALMSVTCEELETVALSQGEPIDLDQYGMLTDRIGRAFARLGLKRVSRDITPSIAQVSASFGSDTSVTEAAKSQRKVASDKAGFEGLSQAREEAARKNAALTASIAEAATLSAVGGLDSPDTIELEAEDAL